MECAGTPLNFDSPHCIALLAYLARHRTSHPREPLISLLWPHADPAFGLKQFEESLTELKDDWELNGFFSSWVDLMDSEKRVQMNLIINFPQKMACNIYEGIFGEVDLEQVAGVVQELVNILGGIVKPRIADYTSEIMELAYWGEEVPSASGALNLDLGLPESKMGEGHTLDIELEGLPKFVLPFESKDEVFYLVVLFQNF